MIEIILGKDGKTGSLAAQPRFQAETGKQKNDMLRFFCLPVSA
jgi:hypothetical protein